MYSSLEICLSYQTHSLINLVFIFIFFSWSMHFKKISSKHHKIKNMLWTANKRKSYFCIYNFSSYTCFCTAPLTWYMHHNINLYLDKCLSSITQQWKCYCLNYLKSNNKNKKGRHWLGENYRNKHAISQINIYKRTNS